MITILEVDSTAILVRSNHDGKTVAEIASYEMVMEAVLAKCEISLLVSQKTHSDPYFKALDDAQKSFSTRQVFLDTRKH